MAGLEPGLDERPGRSWRLFSSRLRGARATRGPSFEGRRQDGPIVLAWTGTEGASGEVRLKLLADDTLQLNWQATEFGDPMGLASGAAILIRRRGL